MGKRLRFFFAMFSTSDIISKIEEKSGPAGYPFGGS